MRLSTNSNITRIRITFVFFYMGKSTYCDTSRDFNYRFRTNSNRIRPCRLRTITKSNGMIVSSYSTRTKSIGILLYSFCIITKSTAI